MSRRCSCNRLFDAFRSDPRIRSLGWATRAFFLLLGEAMAGAENPGFLGFSSVSRVSLLVSVPETETETQMETLIAEGLLVRTAEGGLACPLLQPVSTRASRAAENGRLGGRPRRNETPEQARLRRAQITLPLAIQGGGAETQAKPRAETLTTTTTTNSSSPSQSGSVARVPAHASLGAEIAELAELDPVRQRFDYAPVREWLEAGISPADIREGVRQVVTRPGYRADKVTTLRYFGPAIRRVHDGEAPQPAAATHPAAAEDEAAEARYTEAYDAWRFGGRRGAPPRFADFARPAA